MFSNKEKLLVTDNLANNWLTNSKLVHLLLALVLYITIYPHTYIEAASHSGDSHTEESHEHADHEEETGPNGGRLLHAKKQNGLELELSLWENSQRAEFRLYPSVKGKPVDPKDVLVQIVLTRLGNKQDVINFTPKVDYLAGDMHIYEPHSFVVSVSAEYQGQTSNWNYDNFEGRTHIEDAMAAELGIEISQVEPRELTQTLTVYGRLTIPDYAKAEIRAPYAGNVSNLRVRLGQAVQKGQVLFSVRSNESLQTYTVKAPIAGLITSQSVVAGSQTADKVLLEITDTEQLMAELQVFPLDKTKVKMGADVIFYSPHDGAKTYQGKLQDALPNLNAQQAKIFRVPIENKEGLLSAGEFVKAEIVLDTFTVPLAVRADALQKFRDFTVVYAKIGDEYEVRMLDLGRRSGDWIEVLSGIEAGTEYVTGNSYLIKADIEKSGASHDH